MERLKKQKFVRMGHYLKGKRKEQRLSQSQVATRLGYTSSQFVSNWERGLCAPPVETLPKLIELYKMGKNEMVEIIVDEHRKYVESVLENTTQEMQQL